MFTVGIEGDRNPPTIMPLTGNHRIRRIHEGALMYGASTQLVKSEEACTETADRVDGPELVVTEMR